MILQPLNWAQENPKCATAAAVGMGVVAAPAIVTAPLLGLVGFGANGVVGGEFLSSIIIAYPGTDGLHSPMGET